MRVTLQKFVQQLVRTGLMPATDVKQFVGALSEQAIAKDDVNELVRNLVRDKKLTAYQAAQLADGQGAGLILGNYVVQDKLGEGGMGIVLKASHRRMRRTVAVKVLTAEALNTEGAVERFQREVQAVARLAHPNIVTAFDADEDHGTHFLVMQFVDGTDLSSLVKRKGPLPVSDAVGCMVQAARGLDYAHSCGVTHRDIKPSNLMLDRAGVIRVLDLGLARIDADGAEAAELTRTEQVMGTLDYMAPEQAVNSKLADARSDIYSLGAALWYLLTGRHMYSGETLLAKMVAHREAPIPSLCAACPSASMELEVVHRKMVAKRPENRYQSMAELAADLERCQSGGTPLASFVPVAASEDSKLSEFLAALAPSAAVAPQPSTGSTGTLVDASFTRLDRSGATALSNQSASDTRPVSHSGAPASQSTSKLPLIQKTVEPWLKKPAVWASIPATLLVLLLAGFLFSKGAPAVGAIELHFDQPEIEGANVYVDGKKRLSLSSGNLPPLEIPADGKSHTVKVSKKGYEPFTQSVKIERGKTEPVNIVLEAIVEVLPETATPNWRARGKPSIPAIPVKSLGAWTPGPPGKGISGLVPLPAKVAGVEHWQMETLLPRAGMNGLQVSPDGKYVALASADGKARILETGTLAPHIVLPYANGPVQRCIWLKDSQSVLLFTRYQHPKLYGIDGRPGPNLDFKPGEIVLSPDGQLLAVYENAGSRGGRQHEISLYHLDGRLESSFPLEVPVSLDGRGPALSWRPDGVQISISHTDQTIRHWNLKGNQEGDSYSSDHCALSIAWSPDGKHFAAVYPNARIQIWSPDGRKEHILEMPENQISSNLAWSRDSRQVAIGSPGVFFTWDVTQAQPTARTECRVDWADHMCGIDAGNAGDWFGVEASGGIVLSRGQKVVAQHAAARMARVTAVDWRADGAELVSAGHGAAGIRLWKVNGEGRAIKRTGGSRAWESIAWSPNQKSIAAGGGGFFINRVYLIDPVNLESRPGEPMEWCYSLQWSPNGRVVAAASREGKVTILNGSGGVIAKTNLSGGTPHISWTADSRKLVALSNDTRSLVTYDSYESYEFRPADAPTSLTRVPQQILDGKWLITPSNGTLYIDDLQGTPVDYANWPDNPNAWDFSPDREQIVTLNGSGIRIRRDGAVVVEHNFPPGIAAWNSSVKWSPDGTRIAVGIGDSTVTVYSAATLQPLWRAVLLPSDHHVTLSAAGEVLDAFPQDVDGILTCIVEDADGLVTNVKPSVFLKRVRGISK